MQTIIHEKGYKYINPIFNDIEHFYSMTSVKKNTRQLVPYTFDSSFTRLSSLFSQFGGVDYTFDYTDKKYAKLPKIQSGKNIIVCFSGGKDSIVTALHYKKLGYNVYLYHLRHINFALTDEYICAEECAKEMELPLIIESLTLSGNHDWMEHPMKNMIIATMALNYGIQYNITTKIAFGNYISSSLEYDVFDRCAGDCKEMWQAYETIIQRIIPKFHIYKFLPNLGTTLNIISQYPKLLDASVSCLCRSNLRQYRWNWIYNKFGVQLPKHRCGNCYKCCTEYIYLADNDKIEYNEEYYKYCLKQLYKVAVAENIYVYEITDLWNHFLFYKINKSKFKDILKFNYQK